MKKMYLIAVLFLCMACSTAILRAQTAQKITVPNDLERWITTTFAKGKIPPFSFVYNDRPSSEFIRKWKHSSSKLTSDDPMSLSINFHTRTPSQGLRLSA